MITDSDKFNFNKIKFKLDVISSPQDKLSFLYNIKLEINKVILCFEKSVGLPLAMYGDSNIVVEGVCDELKQFVTHELDSFSKSGNKATKPSEDQLRESLKKEVMNYIELSKLINSEIEYYNKQRDRLGISEEPRELETIKIDNNIDSEKQTDEKSNSNKTNKISKVTWLGNREELVKLFENFNSLNLLAVGVIEKTDEIIKQFFVDKSGNKLLDDKNNSKDERWIK